MKDRVPDDDAEVIDNMICDFEADLRHGSAPTTARILTGLDTVLWELARMDEALRLAPPGVVTPEDVKTFRKAFGRISREAEVLERWLRSTPIEQPRN